MVRQKPIRTPAIFGDAAYYLSKLYMLGDRAEKLGLVIWRTGFRVGVKSARAQSRADMARYKRELRDLAEALEGPCSHYLRRRFCSDCEHSAERWIVSTGKCCSCPLCCGCEK